MPLLKSNLPTLVDVVNVMDPNGAIMAVAEILNQTNEILEDVPFMEGNLPTGHQYAMRTGIPVPTWRKFNQGVQPTKATAAKVTEAAGMMEGYAEVDKALADLNGNSAAFRASQDRPLIQGFSHEFASNLIYGNESVNAERFTGFAARFNSLSGSVQTSQNVINGGGTGGTNTSIWLVVWAEHTAYGFYPKGSRAGLEVTDKGQVTIENADGQNGRMEGYRRHYRWDVGLAVPDWRFIVRIANVDVALLVKDAASGGDLIDLMTIALEQVQNTYEGRAAFYVNRRVRTFLRRQMVNKIKQSTLTWEMVGGKRVMMFEEVPVRRVDAILNTEAAVA